MEFYSKSVFSEAVGFLVEIDSNPFDHSYALLSLVHFIHFMGSFLSCLSLTNWLDVGFLLDER